MFDEHPFNHKMPSMKHPFLPDEPLIDEGIYYVSQDKNGLYLKEDVDECLYLKKEEDKILLNNYLNQYVFAQIEVYPDDTCTIHSVFCNSLLKKMNRNKELGLDFSMVRQLYYANSEESERFIDILFCCIHHECYDGDYLTNTYLDILVKWLIKRVNMNRYLLLDDIFEDVYLPCGEKMTHHIYQYLLQTKGIDRMFNLDIFHYLLFVNKKQHELNHSFDDTYEEFKKRYPTYQQEIMQMLTYVYSLRDTVPMNFMLKGANTNEFLMILNEICEYLKMPIIELSVSSFGDAGDLSGFNASYSGAEKGRIAEQVLKYHTTSVVFVLKGLDEVNTSSSSHSSVLAALCEMLSHRKLNDNYFKWEMDLSHALFVGTCFNENHVNPILANSFYAIKDTTQISKEIISNELYSHLNKLQLENVMIDEKVIDRLVSISLKDPFHEIYRKYCSIIAQHYCNNRNIDNKIDMKFIEEVFDTFEIIDPMMKPYFEYYEDYSEEIIDRFQQLFHDLRRENQMTQEKLNYLSCCRKNHVNEIDLSTVERDLNESHIGLEHVKEALLNTLYQYPYDEMEPNHLLFYSTYPGVGKTSIALDACHSCHIPVIHINCAQISSLVSLYGDSTHPGLLLSKIKEIETIQAPIFLDEFDKCDPYVQNSLLNLTDTKNASFYSPYLEVNVPIHCRFMIATANDLTKISLALKDRFRIIEFKPYSIEKKKEIIQDKILKDLNQQFNQFIDVSDDDLNHYLLSNPFVSIREMKSDFYDAYTNACRNHLQSLSLNSMNQNHFNEGIYSLGVMGNQGCATHIECLFYKGKDTLKGNCKDVFRESFEIVLMALRYQHILEDEHVFMNIYGNPFEKDGCSAGLAMTACICAKKMNLDLNNVAFTGEVTLHGKVEAVGGIYYKLLACKQRGIRRVVLPFDNYEDYVEIAKDLEGMEIYFVKNIQECIALLDELKDE